jgi:hypothetical protein
MHAFGLVLLETKVVHWQAAGGSNMRLIASPLVDNGYAVSTSSLDE